MTRKKPIAPVPAADPPEQCCGHCWYFETINHDCGHCFGGIPLPDVDEDGTPTIATRPIVSIEDRGCVYWRARHTA